jgi:predicted small secreted protein
MKRGLTVVMALLVLLLSGCSNTTEPETKDLRLSSNYEITAALDPYNNILEYTARIQISNNGRNSTDELYFHLYGNLYKTESEGIEIISVTDEKEKAVPFTLKDDNQL